MNRITTLGLVIVIATGFSAKIIASDLDQAEEKVMRAKKTIVILLYRIKKFANDDIPEQFNHDLNDFINTKDTFNQLYLDAKEYATRRGFFPVDKKEIQQNLDRILFEIKNDTFDPNWTRDIFINAFLYQEYVRANSNFNLLNNYDLPN